MEKTHKCLVWLDNGPYSYLNYAISVSLSKKGSYEFYGMSVTEKDFAFFRKQSIINFKELFYYPECYIQKKSPPDIDYLRNIEKNYGLNLWLDAYGERLFYQYRTEFYSFSREEILNIIESTIKFFIDFFERVKPDFIIMQTAGENIANLLLYQLAKKMNVIPLMLNFARLHNLFALSDNTVSREISEEFHKLKRQNIDINDYNVVNLNSKSQMETVKVMQTFVFDKATSLQKMKRYSHRLFTDPEPIYQNKGKRKSKMIQWRINTYFEVKKRKNFLDKSALKEIPNESFVYFPLHTQPEATTLVNAPFFNDQLTLIENIAKSLPVDCLLYVKEHPGQKLKLWRPVNYYETIIEMPNVKLIHPDVDSNHLISKSKLVISITGTSGFEAIIQNKPVLLFSDTFYDSLTLVTKIEKYSDLPSVIRKCINLTTNDKNDLAYLIKAIENVSINIPYIEMWKDALLIPSTLKYSGIPHAQNHFENFYKKYNNEFDKIANAYKTKLLSI
jgi:hypothetical protein